MSTLPVPYACLRGEEIIAPLVGNVVKHWNNYNGYNFNTDYSEMISISTTVELQNGQRILLTNSNCQIQSRVLVEVHQSLTNNPSIVWYEDLCT
jgi:GTP cyclohydrolase III